MRSALTIAGSDSSGGAGIQADIKAMMAQGVFAQSVITALTAQNTQGVYGILATPPEFVSAQLEAVFQDIRPDAVKVGMVSDPAVATAIAEGLRRFEAHNVVVDPVMVATSGAALSDDEAVHAVVRELFPLASLVTPNLTEASVLEGIATGAEPRSIGTREDMVRAGKAILGLGCAAVLVKGGHVFGAADDVLLTADGAEEWFSAERVDTDNTHGTGCTLSSAIAANLAKGCDVRTAVGEAKRYLTGALQHDPHLGHGNGPLNHAWEFFPEI
jgi:hydroxymethylpyrimidine/phosphomethylpyrimidine kinase